MSNFSINRAILLGNLSRDPELRETKTGKSVLTLNLVTNHSIKNADGTYKDLPTFHRVIVWGNISKWLSKNLAKGSKVYVDGRISTSEYTDKEGKVQRSREIIAENVIPMTGNAPSQAKRAVNEEIDAFPGNAATQAKKELESQETVGEDVSPEEIPF